MPWWKRDNYCDDVNNVASCDFDGGDCCRPNAIKIKPYCKVCACLEKGIASACSILIRRGHLEVFKTVNGKNQKSRTRGSAS